MARRSLKPQLNQIRTWVRQGRTDAWIAHQLDVSVKDISAFKREHELEPGEAAAGETDLFGPRMEEEEPDLRAEDEALVAAALEAEQDEEPEETASGTTRRTAMATPRTTGRATATATPSPAAGAAGAAGAAVAAGRARRSTAPSTTARRATACGSTPPSRTTPYTPSTGPATGPSRWRSRPTAS